MRLLSTVIVALCLAIALPGCTVDNEVIYLSDTNDLNGDDGISVLYRVDIDDETSSATLTMLPNGVVNYNHVDAIAAEPDGSIIWMIDSGGSAPRTLAGYDVSNAAVFEVGELSIADTDQAAMSPAGTLYITTEAPGKLYTVDTEFATVTLIGSLPAAANGGDLTFDADGTLYMLNTNGLYELTLPAVLPGVIAAVKIGADSSSDYSDYTGMAARANGFGELIASHRSANAIRELSSSDGSVLMEYPMVGFDHGLGDMATGLLVLCTRTIGYWKNHDWNEAFVYINGEMIDEATGRGLAVDGEQPKNGYLWNARGNTYSMLYAQLIAAKLNTNDAGGNSAIAAAEAFLVGKAFEAVVEKSEKKTYSDLVVILTTFNESYDCDEDQG